jgi:hypothetical protein
MSAQLVGMRVHSRCREGSFSDKRHSVPAGGGIAAPPLELPVDKRQMKHTARLVEPPAFHCAEQVAEEETMQLRVLNSQVRMIENDCIGSKLVSDGCTRIDGVTFDFLVSVFVDGIQAVEDSDLDRRHAVAVFAYLRFITQKAL